jgi:hypothetical protein
MVKHFTAEWKAWDDDDDDEASQIDIIDVACPYLLSISLSIRDYCRE